MDTTGLENLSLAAVFVQNCVEGELFRANVGDIDHDVAVRLNVDHILIVALTLVRLHGSDTDGYLDAFSTHHLRIIRVERISAIEVLHGPCRRGWLSLSGALALHRLRSDDVLSSLLLCRWLFSFHL